MKNLINKFRIYLIYKLSGKDISVATNLTIDNKRVRLTGKLSLMKNTTTNIK